MEDKESKIEKLKKKATPILEKWFSRKTWLTILLVFATYKLAEKNIVNGSEWVDLVETVFFFFVLGNVGQKAVYEISGTIGRNMQVSTKVQGEED